MLTLMSVRNGSAVPQRQYKTQRENFKPMIEEAGGAGIEGTPEFTDMAFEYDQARGDTAGTAGPLS